MCGFVKSYVHYVDGINRFVGRGCMYLIFVMMGVLLFSAVSLILLAYTNRFLSYAQLVRQLRDRYMENPTDITVAQIENLRKRLNLTRTMQGLGIASLFFCVVSMFLIYIGLQLLSAYVFGLALILLIASLGVSFREIQISTRSLEIYLGTMEKGKKK